MKRPQVFGPDRAWMHRTLAAGHLPLWNPTIFDGWPAFASQQGGLLSPFSWPEILSPARGTAVAVVAKVAVGGLGTMLLGRGWGMGTAGALTAAVAFSGGAYVVDWIFHPHSAAYACLPWALLGAHGLTSAAPRPRHLALLVASVAGLWVAGHPQSAAICTAYVGAFALVRVAVRAGGRRRTALLAGVAIALGIGVAAVQLLPLVQMLRVADSAERGGSVGPSLRSLWALVVPDWWGNPSTTRDLVAQAPGSLSNYFERTVYVGVGSVLLAVVGATRLSGAPRWLRAFLVVTVPVAILFALDVPGVSAELARAPGLRAIGLGRVLVLLSFALAMLAGFGVEAVRRRGLRPEVVVVLAAGAAVVLVLLKLGVPGVDARGLQDPEGAGGTTRFAILAAGTLALLGAGALRPEWRRAAAIGLALVVALDVGLHARGMLPRQPLSRTDVAATPAVRRLQQLQGPGRVVGGPGNVLQANVTSRYGLRVPNGRGLPVPRRVVEAGAAFAQPVEPNRVAFAPLSGRVQQYLAQRAVSAVLTDTAPRIPGAVLDSAGPDGRVFRVASPTPRASIVTAWTPVPGEPEAVSILNRQTTTSVRDRPVIETTDRPTGPARSAIGATVAEDGPGDVRVALPPHPAGYLVLRDTYFPGWEATVDGREVPIRAAGVDLRGVAVPAGAREVRFRYRPPEVAAGAAVSGASLLAALLGAGWWWRRDRRRGAARADVRPAPDGDA